MMNAFRTFRFDKIFMYDFTAQVMHSISSVYNSYLLSRLSSLSTPFNKNVLQNNSCPHTENSDTEVFKVNRMRVLQHCTVINRPFPVLTKDIPHYLSQLLSKWIEHFPLYYTYRARALFYVIVSYCSKRGLHCVITTEKAAYTVMIHDGG